MVVTLPADVEQLVEKSVRNGVFASPNEAAEIALRLLLDDGSYYAAQRIELRRELEAASAQVERGEYVTFTSAKELAASVVARGKELQRKRSEE